jgi:GT2 family glycosyltransferase
MTQKHRLAVILASAGRPELLADVLRNLSEQRGVEFPIVVSVPDRDSLPTEPGLLDGVTVVTGVRGLAAQRNAGLEALSDIDVVAFFDDDSVLRSDYLAEALAFFDQHDEIVGLTGRVLLDGSVKGEVPRDVADAALAASAAEPPSARWRPWRQLHGSNFVVRVDRAPQLRFDDRLPLYSWLEDHDFARRLRTYGPLAKVDNCVTVHRAAASGGRQSHLRLGYSQVMNPIYLATKGSFPLWLTVQQIFRVVAKNVALSVAGGGSAWRRERLRGNAMAASDALRGRITPERIVELS